MNLRFASCCSRGAMRALRLDDVSGRHGRSPTFLPTESAAASACVAHFFKVVDEDGSGDGFTSNRFSRRRQWLGARGTFQPFPCAPPTGDQASLWIFCAVAIRAAHTSPYGCGGCRASAGSSPRACNAFALNRKRPFCSSRTKRLIPSSHLPSTIPSRTRKSHQTTVYLGEVKLGSRGHDHCPA